ncbi:MAG TPA: hypothetical protein VFC65_11350 [Prolixibacteraceae bacterium]|nr:hypothetical protein [Prolixibacteraceae bacterium]
MNQLHAETPHDKKLARYQRNWNRIMPNQTKLQFAGSMGMFSAGPGWSYGKRNQWETDWFIGFIPEIEEVQGHMTTTIKQTYTPFRIRVNDFISLEPVTTGIYINKIFGEYFWSKLPEKYPKNYYFWAVNTRFNVFLGQSVAFRMGTKTLGKELSFFYEFNTNDLYLISAFGNETIGLKEIVGLSFGIRYRVF